MNLAFANSSYQLIIWYWYAMMRFFTESCLQAGYKLFHELELLPFQPTYAPEKKLRLSWYMQFDKKYDYRNNFKKRLRFPRHFWFSITR